MDKESCTEAKVKISCFSKCECFHEHLLAERPLNSYQSQCSLEDGGESVFLHHKDVGRFALHCEPVGLTVEAHRTHKVLELGQQVSQLRAQQQHRKDREKFRCFWCRHHFHNCENWH